MLGQTSNQRTSNQLSTRTLSNGEQIQVQGKGLLNPGISHISIIHEDPNRLNSLDSSDMKREINSFRMNAVKMLSVEPVSFIQSTAQQASPEVRQRQSNEEQEGLRDIQFESMHDNVTERDGEEAAALDPTKTMGEQQEQATGFEPVSKVIQVHHRHPASRAKENNNNNMSNAYLNASKNSQIRMQHHQSTKNKNKLLDKINKIMIDGQKEKQIIELQKIKVKYQINNISKTETNLPYQTASKSQKEIRDVYTIQQHTRTLSNDKHLQPYGQSSATFMKDDNVNLSGFNKSQFHHRHHKRSTSYSSEIHKSSTIQISKKAQTRNSVRNLDGRASNIKENYELQKIKANFKFGKSFDAGINSAIDISKTIKNFTTTTNGKQLQQKYRYRRSKGSIWENNRVVKTEVSPEGHRPEYNNLFSQPSEAYALEPSMTSTKYSGGRISTSQNLKRRMKSIDSSNHGSPSSNIKTITDRPQTQQAAGIGRSLARRKNRRISINKSVSMISVLTKDNNSLATDETKNKTINQDLVPQAIAEKWTKALMKTSTTKDEKAQSIPEKQDSVKVKHQQRAGERERRGDRSSQFLLEKSAPRFQSQVKLKYMKKTEESLKKADLDKKPELVHEMNDKQASFLKSSNINYQPSQIKNAKTKLTKEMNNQNAAMENTFDVFSQIQEVKYNDVILQIPADLELTAKLKMRQEQYRIMNADPTQEIKQVSKLFSAVNYEVKNAVTKDEEKFQLLYSEHQAVHRLNYVLSLPINDIEKNNMSVTIKNQLINVIQGNAPVYCKIFVGDRTMPQVKLNIKLATEMKKAGNKPPADGAAEAVLKQPHTKYEQLNYNHTKDAKKVLLECEQAECPDLGFEKQLRNKMKAQKRVEQRIADLQVLISNSIQFPNEYQHDKSYFNEREILHHVNPNHELLQNQEINVTKDIYKPSNIKNDPLNIINRDKHQKANQEEHVHETHAAGSLYLAFKSERGCALSVDIKISGCYTQSFLSGEHNSSDLKIQYMHQIKKEKNLFRFKSKAQHLYDDINNARYLSQHQKEVDIQEMVESLDEYKIKEEAKQDNAKNWSHINFTKANLAEVAHYTPMWQLQQRHGLLKQDILRGIQARYKKENLNYEFHQLQEKNNNKWNNYNQQRSEAAEKCVEIIKKAARMKRFIILLKVQQIFQKQAGNTAKQIIYQQNKFQYNFVMSKMNFLYRCIYVERNNGGRNVQQRERHRIRHKLSFFHGVLKHRSNTPMLKMKIFLEAANHIYDLKQTMMKYLKSKVIIRLFKFHLNIQTFFTLIVTQMVLKEKRFLIEHLKFRKESTACKNWLAKIKILTKDQIVPETETLSKFFKKQRLYEKYKIIIKKYYQRIQCLKALNDLNDQPNNQLIKTYTLTATQRHLSKQLCKSGYRHDFIRKIISQPYLIYGVMLRDVHTMRWLKTKQQSLESELIGLEVDMLSDVKIMKNEGLVELSTEWQKFRVANDKSTYADFLDEPCIKQWRNDHEQQKKKERESQMPIRRKNTTLGPGFKQSRPAKLEKAPLAKHKSSSVCSPTKLFLHTQLLEDQNEKLEDLVEENDNDSLLDLQEVVELANPSRFVLDDWKSLSQDIIPSKAHLQRLIFKIAEQQYSSKQRE